MRFIFDEFVNKILFDPETIFSYFLAYDIVAYFDGLSLSALLIFHLRNFRVVTDSNKL